MQEDKGTNILYFLLCQLLYYKPSDLPKVTQNWEMNLGLPHSKA